MSFFYYFENPGLTGYDFVAVTGSIEEARLMAKQSATNTVDPSQLPAVLRDLTSGIIGCHHTPKALAIFTECDPVLSLECRERLDHLEDGEALLKELFEEVLGNCPPLSRGWDARMLIRDHIKKAEQLTREKPL
jgi:hypothetical protein